MFCILCGSQLDEDSVFCSNCGGRIKGSLKTAPKQKKIFCSDCGNEIDVKNDKFCTKCGKSVLISTVNENPNPHKNNSLKAVFKFYEQPSVETDETSDDRISIVDSYGCGSDD